MSELNPVVGVGIHATLSLSGFIGNSFILLIHFLDWLKTREINPCDLIINSIVLSNIFLQGTVLCNEICFFLFLPFYAQAWVLNSLGAAMASLAFSSLWCSTCLCFYYCVKIVNLSGACFYKMKSALPRMVPWLLLFAIALSWATGLPTYWDIHRNPLFFVSNSSNNGTPIITYNLNVKSRCKCLFQIFMMVSAVAFTVISITAGTIIYSLYMHMRRMKQNSEGFTSSKVSSHISAARTITLLLILYLCFYGALNAIFNETTEIGTWMFSLCFILVSGFPSINAVILITGNRKLSNFVRKLFGMKSGTTNSEVSVS
ncbi:taste receptor type 2 member 7-like [Dendropsophus ebraccatus]|uniref:taste receptor type 2 member 7-like n=1 Tax=Dendropsophus ebraccatus TaxID=150705 RepID=UPI0038316AA1